jgi:ubiquinone/menaquinone biosynthesis C-methylase UbiE
MSLEFDERTVERLEQAYRGRDMVRRRGLVREALGAQPGDRVLDVGCGPGFFELELIDEVGAGGSVTGVDLSPASVAHARERSAGHPNLTFHEADATALPVEDGEFDRAFSVQVLEYVPDVGAALRELRRALRPGGRLVVWDVDWATVSMRTEDEPRMERVLAAWDAHLTHPSLPRMLTQLLREAGFEEVTMEAHPFATGELTPESYGGFLVPFVEQFVGTPEATAWADEQRALAESGEFYFACIQFCFTASNAASPRRQAASRSAPGG